MQNVKKIIRFLLLCGLLSACDHYVGSVRDSSDTTYYKCDTAAYQQWAIAAAAVAAAGALASSTGNTLTSIYNTDKTNHMNRAMSNLAYEHDVDMWNKNNAYNDPSAQMARLEKAGLNPNLVYGGSNGAVAGNTSGQIPKYNAPQLQSNVQFPDIGSVINQFADFRIKNEQADSIATMRELNAQKIISEGILQAGNVIRNARGSLDLNTAQKLQQTQVETAFASLKNLQLAANKTLQDMEWQGKLGQNTLALGRNTLKDSEQSRAESRQRVANSINEVANRNILTKNTILNDVQNRRVTSANANQKEYENYMRSNYGASSLNSGMLGGFYNTAASFYDGIYRAFKQVFSR